jgi:virginiamycin B lyase
MLMFSREVLMPRALLALAILAATASAPAADLGSVEVKEWTVPWEKTRPRDPFVDPAGNVWFVGQEGHYLGRLDPKTGEFQKVDLEPGTGPHNLLVDSTGAIWYTGNLKGYIAKFDPATGKTQRYPMPEPEAKDPHTLALGSDDALWFTVQFGGFVGRLSTRTGEVKLVKLPTPGARPYGIVVDSKGRPWFNEFGTNKIGTLDPRTLRLKEYSLPNENARSRRIAVTKDDAVWFVDYARGYLGRLDTATGQVKEWPTPEGEQSLPYAMTADDAGRLWLVETGPQPNRLVGFDPRTEKFMASTEIKSGGGTVRHMVFDKRGRQIWFGTDKNTIARARVP